MGCLSCGSKGWLPCGICGGTGQNVGFGDTLVTCGGCSGRRKIICITCGGSGQSRGGSKQSPSGHTPNVARSSTATGRPYQQGEPWSSSVQPPTYDQAIARVPDANIFHKGSGYRVFYINGRPTDWWHQSKQQFEFIHVLHIKAENGADNLIFGLAVDDQIKDRIWGRSDGRYAFCATKDMLVLIGFSNDRHHINLTSHLKRLHKPSFSFGFRWPDEREIDNSLV